MVASCLTINESDGTAAVAISLLLCHSSRSCPLTCACYSSMFVCSEHSVAMRTVSLWTHLCHPVCATSLSFFFHTFCVVFDCLFVMSGALRRRTTPTCMRTRTIVPARSSWCPRAALNAWFSGSETGCGTTAATTCERHRHQPLVRLCSSSSVPPSMHE